MAREIAVKGHQYQGVGPKTLPPLNHQIFDFVGDSSVTPGMEIRSKDSALYYIFPHTLSIAWVFSRVSRGSLSTTSSFLSDVSGSIWGLGTLLL